MALTINNEAGVNYVMAIHWWFIMIEAFIFLEIIEYALAIAWAHFVVDKKNFRKKLQQAQATGSFIDADGRPIPLVLRGYYFGNKGWYRWMGRMVDHFLYFFFGYVDYQKDPYTRNKVDYVSRIIFSFGLVFYAFLYACITTIYWSGNFNDVNF